MFLAGRIADSIARRGRATVAVSGGSTPTAMLERLAAMPVDWVRLHIFQVDERVVPDGDPDRNATGLCNALLIRVGVPDRNIHLMPVTAADPTEALDRYEASLPAAFDVVHLGMGDDGHTASLPPGDPVLDVADRSVAFSGEYKGRRRMTLTYPVLERAWTVLWLVCGASKRDALHRAWAGDRSLPAARLANPRSIWFVDDAAIGEGAIGEGPDSLIRTA